tara:strand:- start:35 stop:928 length:894 start_codon:yes stop_codon:yes gene_type:complete
MRIHNYPTDVLTGTEQFLASNFNTVTQEYETVNFTVDTLKTFLTSANEFTNLELGGSIIFEGATVDNFETTLNVTDPTADRTVTIPDATGFVALYSVDPAGVTITSTPAELNKLDGYAGSVTELNYLKDLYDTGVTATEYDYLDITTLGTSENSKVVTAGAGGIVKLTGELQVSYASPRIFLEDTGSNRADTLVHQLNDLFRIDTKANGGSFVTALDIDASLANPTVTIHKKLTMGTGANIESGNDISAGQFKVPNLNSAPASASASGTQGDIVFANDAIYVCVATNTWKKAALSTF